MTATAPLSRHLCCLASVTSMMTPRPEHFSQAGFQRRLVEFPFFDPWFPT